MQREFWALKDAFSNFSASTLAEIQTLSFHGEGAPPAGRAGEGGGVVEAPA